MNTNRPFWRTLPYCFSLKGDSVYRVQDRDYNDICDMKIDERVASSVASSWSGDDFYIYSDKTNPENEPHWLLDRLEYLMQREIPNE